MDCCVVCWRLVVGWFGGLGVGWGVWVVCCFLGRLLCRCYCCCVCWSGFGWCLVRCFWLLFVGCFVVGGWWWFWFCCWVVWWFFVVFDCVVCLGGCGCLFWFVFCCLFVFGVVCWLLWYSWCCLGYGWVVMGVRWIMLLRWLVYCWWISDDWNVLVWFVLWLVVLVVEWWYCWVFVRDCVFWWMFVGVVGCVYIIGGRFVCCFGWCVWRLGWLFRCVFCGEGCWFYWWWSLRLLWLCCMDIGMVYGMDMVVVFYLFMFMMVFWFWDWIFGWFFFLGVLCRIIGWFWVFFLWCGWKCWSDGRFLYVVFFLGVRWWEFVDVVLVVCRVFLVGDGFWCDCWWCVLGWGFCWLFVIVLLFFFWWVGGCCFCGGWW